MILSGVRILILVDQNVLKLCLPFFSHFWDFLKETNGLEKQVIKIKRIGSLAHFFVCHINFGNIFLIRKLRRRLKLNRSYHFVLCTRDSRTDTASLYLFVANRKLLHRLLDESLSIILVINNEVLSNIDCFTLSTEHAHANAVKCSHPRHETATRAVLP
ncbi:hypothetical protein D9M69_616090 [compost metagenome]